MATAFITGASEGIGFEFSKQLAQRGVNLFLVARNQLKLEQMAHDFNQSYGILVNHFAVDLSLPEGVTRVIEEVERQNFIFDYVINNAGYGTSGPFETSDWHSEVGMYQLNMISLAHFTHYFARQMKLRGCGHILNVASTASFQPVPGMAGYAATKSFVLSLSQALSLELKGTGVSVTTICPGVTESKFHATAHTETSLMRSKFLPKATSAAVAEFGIKKMLNHKSLGVHGLHNRVMVFLNRFLPRRWVMQIITKAMAK